MKIGVLTGSPHKKGTSARLTEEFIKGVKENGHEVYHRFDTAFECVHPCIGCDMCQFEKNPCVFKDGMMELYPRIIEADMIVFVTLLYYHAMSSQIKMSIDRFHGIDNLIRNADKRAMLIVTTGSKETSFTNGVTASYHEMLHYLG